MFRKVQHIHFVGIGGVGMSGIAEILLNMGFRVSGSDKSESEQTRRLASMGGTIYVGHDPRHIEGAEVLVYSSAVRSDNVEIVAARQQKIPVIPRAEMLAELMRLRYGIAVAGAHGKTTTTTMVATVLAEGGLDPTAVIGGKVNSFGGHAKKGEGDFLVAEADESDGSFLKLSPTVAVVTTIDREHLDYYRTFEAIQATFLSFINKVPFYGLAVLCGDDRAIAELIPKIEKRYLTYGLEKEAATRGAASHLDLVAEEMAFQPWKTTFQTRFHGESLGRFTLPVPGRHNVLNALAAIAVGLELEIPIESIRKGLEGYRGVERRFQLQGEKNGVWVIDDYGHHPTEIRATLAAAKRGWGCELLVLFQPHRYTRTRDLLDDLAGSFTDADHLILTDIYAAGEPPIPGIDGERLYQAVVASGHPDVTYLPDRAEMRAAIEKKVKPGMMMITLGAGDIWKVGKEFLNDGRG
jgi:UDP-N-acetylmuramate--alanine ligase